MEKGHPVGRLYFVFAILALGFAGVVARLFMLQVVDTEANRKNFSSWKDWHYSYVQVSPVRGEIFDRNGLPLSVNRVQTILSANPSVLKDIKGNAADLGRALNRPARGIFDKLQDKAKKGSMYVVLARNVDWTTTQEIMKLRIPQIHYKEDPRRTYPQGALAGSVLGHISHKGEGVSGIERSYGTSLAGLSVRQEVPRAIRGTNMPEHDYSNMVGLRGSDLVLTIDAYLQHVCEKELAAGVQEFSASHGVAILMNHKNGEVLAMAQCPGFDPNEPGSQASDKNRCIGDVFEPGSVLKPFTFALAMEAGVIDENTMIDCRYTDGGGWRPFPDVRYRVKDYHPLEIVPAWEVLAESSNIGTAKICLMAEEAGHPIRDFMSRAGFGHITGIDLPGERKASLFLQKYWARTDPVAVSFGKSIDCTAIQLISRFACFGNGGVIPLPHITQGRRSPTNNELFPIDLPTPERLLSSANASKILKMLHKVTTEGTGDEMKLPGYRFCGKTGTSKLAVAGTYSNKEVDASFIGFAPYPDPEFVLLVWLHRPYATLPGWGKKNKATGGRVAGPVWTAIAEQTLHYMGVPPQPELLPEIEEKSTKVAGGRP
jgi:cell division protein FtsI (penicillin-binding protein 3)